MLFRSPYKAVADAMEVIPRTLVENSGDSPIRVLTRLRAKHVEGNYSWGINGDTGAIVDMKEYGVWEPEAVKLQSIKTAVEVCTTIMLCAVSWLTKYHSLHAYSSVWTTFAAPNLRNKPAMLAVVEMNKSVQAWK